MKNIPLRNVKIEDKFWNYYCNLAKDVIIPYQWEALNDRIEDAEPSGCINNFKIAAGEKQDGFVGMVFQDSDLGKWIEAAAYSLASKEDKALEATIDEAIDLMGRGQGEDGYLNTYFTVKEPGKRWTNLWECHELYCLGHLIEGAVAYYEVTGKSKFLDIVSKYADYVGTVFGSEEDKLHGYDGHEEIELALTKLYKVTGKEKYLKMAEYFILERGKEPHFFGEEVKKHGGVFHWSKGEKKREPNEWDKKYNQTNGEAKDLEDVDGHAVRAVYLATGMADVARETGNKELIAACRRLWDSATKRRMYITGAIGSSSHGEAITFDYDLPNDTIYGETCASIGLIFFANRMLQLEAKSEYADVIDSALYNTVLASVSLDGKRFFYVNPLEIHPEACEKNHDFWAIKPVRQKWFGCACCPPNLARLLTSLGQYIYSVQGNTIFSHLYIGNKTEVDINNSKVEIVQEGNYPFDNEMKISISSEQPQEFTFAFRIPAWSKNTKVKVNGEAIDASALCKDGYVYLGKSFRKDIIEIEFDLKVEVMVANPKVKADGNKIAILRGPVVYCMEEIDNGKNLHDIIVYPSAGFELSEDKSLPLPVPAITANKAVKSDLSIWNDKLYMSLKDKKEEAIKVKLVPYFLWGNRNNENMPGEMMVWCNYRM